MRIDHPNQPPTGSSTRLGVSDASPVKTSSTTGSTGSRGGASSDQVQLSGLSSLLNLSSGMRASQVSNLAKLVRTGMYQVSSAAISHSLVSEALAGSALSRAR